MNFDKLFLLSTARYLDLSLSCARYLIDDIGTVHQFFCILHFCHTCSLCRVELVVQFPARVSTQVLCIFPGVLLLWHFLYSVGPHPVSSRHIYTFVVSRAFMVGMASQAGDADSNRAPGLTSGLQGSVNVHRGALLLVPQWQCISSFVFCTSCVCSLNRHYQNYYWNLAHLVNCYQLFKTLIKTKYSTII